MKKLFAVMTLPKRALSLPRIGWHSHTFVLPDTAFGDTDELVLQLRNVRVAKKRSALILRRPNTEP
jgi:hypothetical protein